MIRNNVSKLKKKGATLKMFCYRKDCCFHRDKENCILPANKNFYVLDRRDTVCSCLNYITQEKELSREGKARLNYFNGLYSKVSTQKRG